MSDLIPMRWPADWTSASSLDLLKGTPINCLVGETAPGFPIGSLQFVRLEHPPEGVVIREGVWPQNGASNASAIRLAQLMDPGKTVWLSCLPPGEGEIPLEGCVRLVAEAETFGAHWILTLDRNLTRALDARNRRAMDA